MPRQQLLSLEPVPAGTTDTDRRAVLDKARAQVGFIPNMYASMVNSPGLLDTYLHGYRHFRESSGFTPEEQEVVFLTISRENGCHYCVSAHSMLADKQSGVRSPILEALRNGEQIPDARLAALGEFTRRMLDSRGTPDPADLTAFLKAGYSEEQVLEIVLALAVKTLSNYSNHLFNTPVDDLFADYLWEK